MTFRDKIIMVAAVGAVVLVADQVTKIWARSALLPPSEAYLQKADGKVAVKPVIGDRPGMEFRLSFNKGAAFGLFNQTSTARIFLSIIGLGALVLIFYLLKRPESDSRAFVLAMALVAGGAVGNLVDRVLIGHVTDFIWVWLTPKIPLVWPWPAFNIADIALVAGVILMVPAMLFGHSLRAPEEEPSASGEKGGARDARGKGEDAPRESGGGAAATKKGKSSKKKSGAGKRRSGRR